MKSEPRNHGTPEPRRSEVRSQQKLEPRSRGDQSHSRRQNLRTPEIKATGKTEPRESEPRNHGGQSHANQSLGTTEVGTTVKDRTSERQRSKPQGRQSHENQNLGTSAGIKASIGRARVFEAWSPTSCQPPHTYALIVCDQPRSCNRSLLQSPTMHRSHYFRHHYP